MLLAIDAGNTNVVFALFEGRELKTRWRIATDPRRTGDEYAVWLMQLMAIQGIGREAVEQIIVSTVVPRALHNLDVLAQNYFGIVPLVAGEGKADWGIEIDVDAGFSEGAVPADLREAILAIFEDGQVARARKVKTHLICSRYRRVASSCVMVSTMAWGLPVGFRGSPSLPVRSWRSTHPRCFPWHFR